MMLSLNVATTPLFDVDEGAFSEATRNMVETGNYITTYLDGNVRFDKPILSYWLQSLGVRMLGVTELAFRLPSLLATLFWVFSVGLFVWQYDRRQNAIPAALVTSASLGILVIGRAATADALLNLFLVLSLFDLYRFTEEPKRSTRYRLYFWMGLGMLTKGPIAILVPLATGVLYLGIGRRFHLIWKALFSPIGWLIFLGVALPWYVLEYLDQGQAFIDGFFMTHNVERFSSTMEQHSGGFLYYLPMTLALLLPFSGLLIPALYRNGQRLMARQADRLDLFLWCWFGFVFLFFSLSGTKLPHYMIYGLIPLIILTLRHLDSSWSGLWLLLPAVALIALIASLPEIARLGLDGWIDDAPTRLLLPRLIGYFQLRDYLWLGGAGVAVIVINLWPNIGRTPRIGVTAVACSFAISGGLMPAVGYLLQEPIKSAALHATRHIEAPIVQWGVEWSSFSVYRQAPTPRRMPKADEVALTRRSRIEALDLPYLTLFEEGDTVLIQLLATEQERE
jgi:4-amino-4-deoxy-L-arabinose transferase-like glycosyltransferase